MISKKDLGLVTIIGAAIALLMQIILSNFQVELMGFLPYSFFTIRVIVFVLFTLFAPLALFIAHLLGKIWSVLYEFAKFSAVGTLNSFVDLGVFNLGTLLLGYAPGGMLFAAFKTVSFLIATTNSFAWNKYWTFGSGGTPQAGETLKFYIITIIGGFLNVGIASFVYSITPPAFTVQLVNANAWLNVIAPIAGILSAALWNFLGYKFLVFKATDVIPERAAQTEELPKEE